MGMRRCTGPPGGVPAILMARRVNSLSRSGRLICQRHLVNCCSGSSQSSICWNWLRPPKVVWAESEMATIAERSFQAL